MERVRKENLKRARRRAAGSALDAAATLQIQKMMKGSREEKNSIAMMMNYLMPPEVVDMVRDKLKITAKRGKIKF